MTEAELQQVCRLSWGIWITGYEFTRKDWHELSAETKTEWRAVIGFVVDNVQGTHLPRATPEPATIPPDTRTNDLLGKLIYCTDLVQIGQQETNRLLTRIADACTETVPRRSAHSQVREVG